MRCQLVDVQLLQLDIYKDGIMVGNGGDVFRCAIDLKFRYDAGLLDFHLRSVLFVHQYVVDRDVGLTGKTARRGTDDVEKRLYLGESRVFRLPCGTVVEVACKEDGSRVIGRQLVLQQVDAALPMARL